MIKPLLLCTDLDRTLLPNGEAPESPQARSLFRHLSARPEVSLAYVSGRHKQLVEEAIERFAIPLPDFVIGDVGTTIYTIEAGNWTPWPAWQAEIAGDWAGHDHSALASLFDDLPQLRLQEAAKQNTFKLSYYVPQDCDHRQLLAAMQERLAARDINASLVWSIDDLEHVGLLDVLPARATKLHAIEFLIQAHHYPYERVVYAGDSGNDLPVLASAIQSVLVANARDDVRAEAIALVEEQGRGASLYLARGDFLGMNGNYSAGILEGICHYIPECHELLAAIRK